MDRPTDEQVRELLERARAVAENAYSPYSGVRVGAALLTEDGQTYSGCNVENASFGLTLCAERSAAVAAIGAGQRSWRAMAIVSNRPAILPPCGACRQFLREFASDLPVYLQGATGEVEATSIAELLPRSFGPQDLA